MEMRVDDQVDLRRVAIDCFEVGADLLAQLEVEFEQSGEARAQAVRRIMLAIRMHAGIEQRRAFWVLDQIGRDRQPDAALTTLHQMPELAGQVAAGKGVDVQAHDAGIRAS